MEKPEWIDGLETEMMILGRADDPPRLTALSATARAGEWLKETARFYRGDCSLWDDGDMVYVIGLPVDALPLEVLDRLGVGRSL